MANESLRIIISGGGTGGHIFPAIAIANALKKINEGTEILFVGAIGRMEMEKVPAAGYNIKGLWISGLQRKFTLQNFLFPIKLIASLMKANKIIKRFKPNAVVGVGGYASGPLLYMAAGNNIPTVIQEQNSFPGITNKMLAKKVNKICVAYSGMEKYFPKDKIIITGNPVRQDILNPEGKRARGLEYFSLSENRKTILVIGGSLGARTINESIFAGMEEFGKQGIQVVWQTGKKFFQRANEAKQEHIHVFDFIMKMDYAYAIADVVISRAGASSVSELCLVRKATILVPSPNVSEDHQTKNAMALVNHNAALLVKDSEARSELVKVAIALVKNEEQQNKLQDKIANLALTNSAEVIANEVLSLARKQILAKK